MTVDILVKSGNASVLIGGCSVCRCVEIVVWSSGHPTIETSVTGGVRSSSGYSSIVGEMFFGIGLIWGRR